MRADHPCDERERARVDSRHRARPAVRRADVVRCSGENGPTQRASTLETVLEERHGLVTRGTRFHCADVATIRLGMGGNRGLIEDPARASAAGAEALIPRGVGAGTFVDHGTSGFEQRRMGLRHAAVVRERGDQAKSCVTRPGSTSPQHRDLAFVRSTRPSGRERFIYRAKESCRKRVRNAATARPGVETRLPPCAAAHVPGSSEDAEYQVLATRPGPAHAVAPSLAVVPSHHESRSQDWCDDHE